MRIGASTSASALVAQTIEGAAPGSPHITPMPTSGPRCAASRRAALGTARVLASASNPEHAISEPTPDERRQDEHQRRHEPERNAHEQQPRDHRAAERRRGALQKLPPRRRRGAGSGARRPAERSPASSSPRRPAARRRQHRHRDGDDEQRRDTPRSRRRRSASHRTAAERPDSRANRARRRLPGSPDVPARRSETDRQRRERQRDHPRVQAIRDRAPERIEQLARHRPQCTSRCYTRGARPEPCEARTALQFVTLSPSTAEAAATRPDAGQARCLEFEDALAYSLPARRFRADPGARERCLGIESARRTEPARCALVGRRQRPLRRRADAPGGHRRRRHRHADRRRAGVAMADRHARRRASLLLARRRAESRNGPTGAS